MRASPFSCGQAACRRPQILIVKTSSNRIFYFIQANPFVLSLFDLLRQKTSTVLLPFVPPNSPVCSDRTSPHTSDIPVRSIRSKYSERAAKRNLSACRNSAQVPTILTMEGEASGFGRHPNSLESEGWFRVVATRWAEEEEEACGLEGESG